MNEPTASDFPGAYSSTQTLMGVDLGGTKLEVVLLEVPSGAGVYVPAGAPPLDPATLVTARKRVPTDASRGYAHIVKLLKDTIESMLAPLPEAQRRTTRIGVGLPGHISRRTGKVKNSNTVCLNGQDLWNELRRALGRPVGFENDANCLTLAEATWGAARGARTVFGVILGTGVGGGIAHEGQVLSGLQGIAGEWGHNVLEPGRPCYCGKDGCVEKWLSGPGLERSLLEAVGPDGACSAADFNQRIERGEPLSAAEIGVLDAYHRLFGKALSGVINILDPEVVVIGGGLSQLRSLYSAGRAQLAAQVFNDELLTTLVPASLGDAAGVYGAALIGEA
ncbi:MAG: ROK family protein [Myxococcota bacterium]